VGAQALLAAHAVDRSVARDRDDPRGWIGRRTVARPALERGRERVLNRLLGEVPVAEGADQGRDGAAVVLAEDALDQEAVAPLLASRRAA
jgi:hypothetical protein